MKIRYLSDLHLEFIKPSHLDTWMSQIPPGLDEVCILAGDLGNPHQPTYHRFMRFISEHFKKAFVIAGDHEYYYHTMEETNPLLVQCFEPFENITFLKESYEIYEGYCFIGTTLWSKITQPKYVINDVYKIPHFDHAECNRLNQESIEFLVDALQTQKNCIVITHHMPSRALIDPKYLSPQMRPYNQWFYCDLDHLFTEKIKGWFYGHTHTPSNTVIQGVPLLCNPIGYPGENKELNFEATFMPQN